MLNKDPLPHQIYRNAFWAMNRGFCLLDIQFDEQGQPYDLIIRDANPAQHRIDGVEALIGMPVRDYFPSLEPKWIERFARVAITGEGALFEDWSEATQRWYEVDACSVGDASPSLVAISFTDITQRKRHEESMLSLEQRKSFLLRLSDEMRPLSDAVSIQYQAAQVLGEFLQANRVGYAETQNDEHLVVVTRHYTREVEGIQGVYRYRDYGPDLLEQMLLGKTVVRADVANDPLLTQAEKQAHAQLQLGATVNVPLVKQGHLVAILFVHFQRAHPFSALELELIEETAERIWAVVERAKAEEALRESEDKYRTLYQSIDEGFTLIELILNEGGQVVDFIYLETNPAFVKQVGLALQGKRRSELFLDQQDFVLAQYQHLFRTGEPLHFEHHVAALGGQWFEVTATRIGGEGSTLLGVVFRNITPRKHQEQRQAFLLTLSDRLRSLDDPLAMQRAATQLVGELLAVDCALYNEVGQHGEIISIADSYVRGNFPQLTGEYGVGQFGAAMEVLRRGELLIIEDQTATPLKSGSERAASKRLGVMASATVPLIKQGRWVANFGVLQGSPRHWREDELALLKETAERTWTAIERAKAEQALQQANRRKDEFLAMLAHELRNPMSTLRSGLQILTLTGDQDETSSATLGMMSRQTDHLVRLVDDLLDVSRISQGKIELKTARLDLVELVRQAAESVRGLYEQQGKQLQIDLPIAPIYVQGDATRLAQVITNLLTNGARYTGERGQVWISLVHRGLEAWLAVRDNGIGLAPDQLSAIFELFVQVDNSVARSKGGLGLGLTLVKRLVELHSGRVEAQSEGLGQGSTFRVHLPTLVTAPEVALVPAERTADPGAQQQILIIDDNADAAMLLGMLLKLKGYEMHTRQSGRTGIEAAEALQPAAVLLDIGMPDLDGYATCQLIRQQPWGESVPVIALTGYGQEEDRQRTKEAGFDGHLVKPVDLNALLGLLTMLLKKD